MHKGMSRERTDESKADYGYAETDPTGRYGRVSSDIYCICIYVLCMYMC